MKNKIWFLILLFSSCVNDYTNEIAHQKLLGKKFKLDSIVLYNNGIREFVFNKDSIKHIVKSEFFDFYSLDSLKHSIVFDSSHFCSDKKTKSFFKTKKYFVRKDTLFIVVGGKKFGSFIALNNGDNQMVTHWKLDSHQYQKFYYSLIKP